MLKIEDHDCSTIIFFAIEPFNGYTQLKHMNFEHVSLWLHLYNHPLNVMNKSCRQKVGGSIGVVEGIDADEDAVG